MIVCTISDDSVWLLLQDSKEMRCWISWDDIDVMVKSECGKVRMKS